MMLNGGGRSTDGVVRARRIMLMVAGEVLVGRFLSEASVAADQLLFVARIAYVQREIVRELVQTGAIQRGQQALADQLAGKRARLAVELAREEAGARPVARVQSGQPQTAYAVGGRREAFARCVVRLAQRHALVTVGQVEYEAAKFVLITFRRIVRHFAYQVHERTLFPGGQTLECFDWFQDFPRFSRFN